MAEVRFCVQKAHKPFWKGRTLALQDFRIFELVASCGSMADAGRVLGISPALVSKHICALEDRLAIKLFCRATACVKLTASGRAFHKRLKAIIPDVEQALRLVSTNDSTL